MKISLPLASGKTLDVDVPDAAVPGAPAWLQGLVPVASALATGHAAEVEVEWAVLRLEADGGRVRVSEPDYASPAATHAFVPGVAATNRVFAAQEQLLQLLRVDPQPVRAAQYLRVGQSALAEVSAFGHRFPEPASEFAGWQICGTEQPTGDTFGQYTVRELAHLRLAWIPALCLPTGWSFRFAGKSLVDCVTPAGETREVMLSLDV
jgi:hypothetical protein